MMPRIKGLNSVQLKISSGIIETIEKTERALTAQELAAILHVSTMSIYRTAKCNALPSFRIGSSLRFDPKVVANWLREQMHPVPLSRARHCG